MYGYSQASATGFSTNNPFANANDPTHASSRFPDIAASSAPNTQYSQWLSNSSMGGGYAQQQQAQPVYGYQQQQQTGYTSPVNPQSQYGVPGSTTQFQPSSTFGQQMSASISGSSYGYLTGQPAGLPQQQQQLGPAQQQISNNPGYVAQFDPYGPLSQWDGTSSQQSQQNQQQQYQQQQQQQQQQYGSRIISPAPESGVSPSGEPHPRDFLRSHKAQIEGWVGQTWNQLFHTFDALANAWSARKTACSSQLEQLKAQLPFAGYYQQQVQSEYARIQQVKKEADSYSDSVVASKYQLQEVFQGYRQSADAAGKRRVREATNAAMQSLPGWPPANI